MATLIVHVMTKCFSDLTLLYIIISTFSFSVILLFYFLYMLVIQINWVIFHLRLVLNLIPVLILALYFILRHIYGVLSLSGKSQMHSGYPVCFWWAIGNTCQYVLNDFFLAKESLSIAKCLGTRYGAVAYVTLAADLSLVSIMQTGNCDRVSTLAKHHFSTYITTTDGLQDSM